MQTSAETDKSAEHAEEALARAEKAENERGAALTRAQAAEQERTQALEQVRQAGIERQAAEQDAQGARKEAERAEQLAAAAERRAEQADERAQAAVDRGDRAEQQSRGKRAELERQLGEQRDARQAAELERGRAQAALDAEQRLRTQLEKDLTGTQKRLEAAEKARDTAIKTLEHAVTRGTAYASRSGSRRLSAGRELGSEKRRSRYLTMPEEHLPAIINPPAPVERTAIWSSPRATLRARSRRRRGGYTSTTGWCSRLGAPSAACRRSRRRRRPSRRSWPARLIAGAAARADRHHDARRPARSSDAAARVRRGARRSELVALDVEDLEFDAARGLKIVIRGSKTDQERAGATVAVPYARASNRCAVRALQAWLHAAAIHRGPVFRRMRRGDTLTDQRLSDQSVPLIVKRRAQTAGLPPALLSGHSLRAGYGTAADGAGVEERKIANVTRHKNLPVLRGYIRAATAFDDVGEVL